MALLTALMEQMSGTVHTSAHLMNLTNVSPPVTDPTVLVPLSISNVKQVAAYQAPRSVTAPQTVLMMPQMKRTICATHVLAVISRCLLTLPSQRDVIKQPRNVLIIPESFGSIGALVESFQ